MYLSIYNSVQVIRTTTAKNRHFYVPRPSFFVCPGNAPVAITQNVARMKRQFSTCQTPRSMYPSTFNTFPVIRTASAKNRRFHVPQPTFLFLHHPAVSASKLYLKCLVTAEVGFSTGCCQTSHPTNQQHQNPEGVEGISCNCN